MKPRGHPPVILNGVVGPSGKKLGDGRPFVANLQVFLKDHLFLHLAEWVLAEFGIELVEPPGGSRVGAVTAVS